MSDHPALLPFRVLATFYPPSSPRNTAIALSSRARLISIEMWGAPLDMQRTLARGRPLLFLALLLARASSDTGVIIWSNPRRELYPPALAAQGIDLGRLFLLQPKTPAEEVHA